MDIRELIAQFSSLSGFSGVTRLTANNPHLRGPLLRAVNYHGTPSVFKEQLARHFAYYLRHFKVLCEEDLPKFLKGELSGTQPYLLITFDDGLKTNYIVASKLLDEFGIKGIFFLPVSLIDQADKSQDEQKEFYLKNLGGVAEEVLSSEQYQPMSWEEVKDLVWRGHAVGSHTLTHCSLRNGLDKKTLEREVVCSRKILEERLQKKVVSFCWTFGGVSDYSKTAYELVHKHYDFAFTTFSKPLQPGGNPYTIDRSNVESGMSIARVKCATQGITELYFLSRRKRFEAIVQ